MTRAVRAGRSRAKSQQSGKPVNGEALLQVVTAVGADVQLIRVPVNRLPWTPTTIHADVGDQITWLAWGHVDLIKPLGTAVRPSTGLLCRVGHGKPHDSGRSTQTFTADCSGSVHQTAIGGPVPARVVNVWLIGVSFVQGGRARAEFRNIELVDGDTVLRIG
jgi:hypothetical protein